MITKFITIGDSAEVLLLNASTLEVSKTIKLAPDFAFDSEISGKGIPKNLQEKVFERFYQVNGSNPGVNNGTGIGLSLVKSMVELHHGKIMLESSFESNFPSP